MFILVSEFPEVAEWKRERAERAQSRQYWEVGQKRANRVINEISDGCVVPSWPSENKLEMSSGRVVGDGPELVVFLMQRRQIRLVSPS